MKIIGPTTLYLTLGQQQSNFCVTPGAQPGYINFTLKPAGDCDSRIYNALFKLVAESIDEREGIQILQGEEFEQVITLTLADGAYSDSTGRGTIGVDSFVECRNIVYVSMTLNERENFRQLYGKKG